MARKHAAGVDKRQSVEDAFRQILLANLSAVREWEPVAVKGKDIEGVHQMRVGFRRMRSALNVFRPVLPRYPGPRVSAQLHKSMGGPTPTAIESLR